MTGERREVDAQRRDVDRHVRDALGGVEDDDRADVVGAGGDIGDRVDRAERVADVGQGDEPRAAGEESVEVVEVEPAVIGDRNVREARAGRRGELLPRDEVGVVLHPGRDDRSPGPTFARPQLYATRFSASVAFRTKTTSRSLGAPMNPARARRAPSKRASASALSS